MKGELWKIINGYEPSEKQLLWFAEIQRAIQENLNEVYSSNISYPHFLERKDDFHAAIRNTIHLVKEKPSHYAQQHEKIK